jgi:hypothetical protein
VGIREYMNKNPMVTTGVAAVIVLIGIVLIITQMIPKSTAAPAPKGIFFSDDDGKTWFADDPSKIPPWDNGGKDAVLACVFRPLSGGDPFVMYLQKDTPQLKAKLESLMSSGGQEAVDAYFDGGGVTGILVKKPGDAKWVLSSKKEAEAITSPPKGPDGKPMQVIQVQP